MDDVPDRLDFTRAETRAFTAGADAAGDRLDRFLGSVLDEFSRAGLQRLIKAGAVRLNGAAARPSARVQEGDRVDVDVPEVRPFEVEPEDLPLEVLYEEATFAVIAKAAGMAVHPGHGRPGGTVANAIAHRYALASTGAGLYRPGIVHRLDLDTSGVMVVARTEAAHARLADAFKERTVEKEYEALVFGDPPHDEDEIDLPLGRDLRDPTRMAVRFDGGRAAVTGVTVLDRFGGAAARILCRPRTGRTHQIRVHLSSRGHPILGDATYAGGRRAPVDVPRLMLHARRLAFPHPETGARMAFEAAPPPDFEAVLDGLEAMR